MMTRLDTTLIRAGTLNSPRDWSTPTKEKATPVNSTVGNITRVRETASSAVWASYPSANRLTRGPANRMPSTERTAESSPITVMKQPAKRKAGSRPFRVRYSLNTGIKQAEIAEANTASKNTLGIRLAVLKALAAIPVP